MPEASSQVQEQLDSLEAQAHGLLDGIATLRLLIDEQARPDRPSLPAASDARPALPTVAAALPSARGGDVESVLVEEPVPLEQPTGRQLATAETTVAAEPMPPAESGRPASRNRRWSWLVALIGIALCITFFVTKVLSPGWPLVAIIVIAAAVGVNVVLAKRSERRDHV